MSMPTKPLLSAVAAFVVAAFVFGFAAISAVPASAATGATSQPPVPLLWKVSDADNSVYLLGSFHLLKPEDYPLSADVDAAFADAESILFEVDPATLNTPDTIARFTAASQYEDGRTLSDVLPRNTRTKLERLLAVAGKSLDGLEQSEPWAVNLGLVLGVSQAMGFRQDQGLDRTLMDRAEREGKPVAGLETIDAQLAALDGVPHSEQVADLDEFLDDPIKAMAEFRAMHESWRAGDVARLDREFRREMAEESPVSYKLVNVDRNRAWMPKLEQRLAGSGDDTLAVVGSLHLLGRDGVVEMLRAKGYTVERICSACK
jgi:uncharacterized protein YbaP (TraB family)